MPGTLQPVPMARLGSVRRPGSPVWILGYRTRFRENLLLVMYKEKGSSTKPDLMQGIEPRDFQDTHQRMRNPRGLSNAK